MSYAIVFSSRTGNTRRLAEAVRAALPAGECLYFGPPDAAALAAGRLYIGFWTDKGSCDEALAAFLPQLAGHEVFLFGTAGFGADPAYFDAILGRVAALLPPSAAAVGRFMCQGRMPDAVRARYAAMPEGERRTQMLANFDMARTHPDAADLAALTAAVRALPPQAFDLRAAKPGDAGVLGALHCRAWRETYPGLLPAAMLQSLSPEKSAARFAQEGCRDMLLAFCGGEPAGFCGFGPWRAGPGAAEGEIIGLYVLKAYQRRGVGTALLRAALAALAARGLDRVSLWVLDGNEKAVQFYESFGFAATGETKGEPPLRERRLRR